MFDYKGAAREALKAEWTRVATLTGDDQFFTRKELMHLPGVLASGEEVLAFCSGLMTGHTWLIALTDRRIIFLDKGMLYGLRQVAIDLDKVNAVSGATGLVFGEIHIEDGAGDRRIQQVTKRTVVPFTNMVRDAMEKRKTAARTVQMIEAEPDLVSQLERLAALKASGALTETEFENAKRGLLKA